jgi:hypothetical protein
LFGLVDDQDEEVGRALECRFCGTTVDPRRVELGYDYCTADDCQRQGLERIELARVAVNKAADQFVRADQVMPKVEMPRTRPDDTPYVSPPSPSSTSPAPARAPTGAPAPARRRIPSTLERLQAAEAELDRRLDASFERFERSEITAAEMAKERDDLIRAFNRMVMAENIRYRHLLRRRTA